MYILKDVICVPQESIDDFANTVGYVNEEGAVSKLYKDIQNGFVFDPKPINKYDGTLYYDLNKINTVDIFNNGKALYEIAKVKRNDKIEYGEVFRGVIQNRKFVYIQSSKVMPIYYNNLVSSVTPDFAYYQSTYPNTGGVSKFMLKDDYKQYTIILKNTNQLNIGTLAISLIGLIFPPQTSDKLNGLLFLCEFGTESQEVCLLFDEPIDLPNMNRYNMNISLEKSDGLVNGMITRNVTVTIKNSISKTAIKINQITGLFIKNRYVRKLNSNSYSIS